MNDVRKETSPFFSFRNAVFVLIAVVGVTISLGLFALLYRWETRAIVDMLEKTTHDHHALFSQKIEAMLQGVEATGNFFETSRQVAPQEFEHFAGYYVAADVIPVLGWVPAEARDPARPGDVCYPIRYLAAKEPPDRREGFDLASIPGLKERIETARDSGSAVVAADDTNDTAFAPDEHRYFVFVPVYREGGPAQNVAQRRERFQGVVFGMFSPEKAVDGYKDLVAPGGLDIAVYERPAPGEAERPICLIPSRMRAAGDDSTGSGPAVTSDRILAGRAEIPVAQTHWVVYYLPIEAMIIRYRTLLPWLYCGVGLLLTLAISLYVRNLLRETESVQKQVDQRTRALRESRQELLLFRDTLEHTPDAVMILDSEMRLIYQNPKSRRMFGYRDGQFAESGGVPILFTMKVASRLLRATVRRGRKWFGETEMRNRQGKTFPALIRGAPVRSEEGETIGYLGIVTDITKQKNRERILQERGVILKSIMEAGSDALLVIDSVNEQVTYYNDRLIEMLGLRREDVEKSNFPAIRQHLLSRLEDGQQVLAQIDQAYRESKPGSAHLAFCDGHFVELNYSPLVRAGNTFGYVWKGYDITDRIEAERQLRRREREARRVQKLEAIGTLAGGIAHEFNNLLQVITGYTSCVLDELPPDDPRHLDLAKAMKAAKRAAELTHQLLSFGGRQVINVKRTDANRLIDEFAGMIGPLSGDGIDVAIRPDASPAWIEADSSELQHLLLNLCINAREAMPAGGTLTLGASRVTLAADDARLPADGAPGDYIVLTVADTGVGMTKQIQERIFDPFFTTKKDVNGTGMGLAIAFGIVEQHRGAIRVESRPGEGTTFRIYLPAGPDEERAAPKTPSVAAVRSQGETILVADDDPMIRDLTVRLLEKRGFRVLTASDGGEAIDLFHRHAEEVSLVILDMVMPGLNGHDTWREIREIRPDTKVIFCTGYDPAQAASDPDTADYPTIGKPMSPDEMYQKIREILDTEPKETGAC